MFCEAVFQLSKGLLVEDFAKFIKADDLELLHIWKSTQCVLKLSQSNIASNKMELSQFDINIIKVDR